MIGLLPHPDHGLRRREHLRLAPLAIDAERRLLHRRGSADTPLNPAPGQQIDRRDLFGDAGRMNELMRDQRHSKAELVILLVICEIAASTASLQGKCEWPSRK